MSNLSIPKRLLKGKKGQNKPAACVSLSTSTLMTHLILFVRQFETHRASTAISPASPIHTAYGGQSPRPDWSAQTLLPGPLRHACRHQRRPVGHHTLPRRPLTQHRRAFSPAPSPSTTEHAPTSSRSSLWLCATTTTVVVGARCAFVPISPARPSAARRSPAPFAGEDHAHWPGRQSERSKQHVEEEERREHRRGPERAARHGAAADGQREHRTATTGAGEYSGASWRHAWRRGGAGRSSWGEEEEKRNGRCGHGERPEEEARWTAGRWELCVASDARGGVCERVSRGGFGLLCYSCCSVVGSLAFVGLECVSPRIRTHIIVYIFTVGGIACVYRYS